MKEVIKLEMKFSKEDSIKIIEGYYKKYENRDLKVRIKSEKGTCGYGIGEMDTCYTSIVLEEEIELLGLKTKTTEKLPEESLLGIFKTVLEEHGYDVTKAAFDDGINHVWEGYFMDEHQVAKVYCHGVNLTVKKNTKQKTLGGK